jgi:small subunit ribosomal protein S6
MKIAVSDKKRVYELTYLVPATYTETEVSAVKDAVAKLISKYKGEAGDSKDWGKKELAYAIKKEGKTHREAVYVHTPIVFEPTKVPEFEKELYLNEDIIRHLVVVADDQGAVA